MPRREKLIQLVESRFGGTQLKAAAALGRSPALVNQWLTGRKPIGDVAARNIERALGLARGQLDAGPASRPVAGPDGGRGARPQRAIPLLSWAQAGNWRQVIGRLGRHGGERVVTGFPLRRHGYALRVRGDAMEPTFAERAVLIVDADEAPGPGKFVIVRQPGESEPTFKQFVQDGGTVWLRPLNPRYPVIALGPDAVFCGVVKRVELDV